MNRFGITFLSAVLLAASVVAAEERISARLEALDEQDEASFPYRQAVLMVENGSDKVIRAVSLRLRIGGPTLLRPVIAAPGTGQKELVDLPAISTRQDYVVRFLAGDDLRSSVLAERVVALNWPAEYVAADEFIDPEAYEPYLESLPLWPAWLRRNVLAAMVLTCVAAIATLFIRRGTVRLTLLIAVVCISAIAIWLILHSCEVIVERDGPDDILAVSCRRTTDWTHAETHLIVLYYSRRQFVEDNTLIGPEDVIAKLRPREVRLFRRR